MSFLQTPDGTRLRYTDTGEGVKTVVLVHGWKGSRRLWEPAVYGLADEFRVVAFDNRGMGESDRPTGAYDIDVLAADLGFVLERLGVEDATLVGWSMGCSISLQYLEGTRDRVARLVLINGPVKLEAVADFPFGLAPGRLDGYFEELTRNWPRADLEFAHEALRDPDDLFADIYYRVALQSELIDSIRIARAQARVDHRRLLAELDLPVLGIVGRHDPYYDEGLAEYIGASAPDGRHLIFEESAHAVHYDETRRFCRVISDFSRGLL